MNAQYKIIELLREEPNRWWSMSEIRAATGLHNVPMKLLKLRRFGFVETRVANKSIIRSFYEYKAKKEAKA